MWIGCYCEGCGIMPHYKPGIQILVGQSVLDICIGVLLFPFKLVYFQNYDI